MQDFDCVLTFTGPENSLEDILLVTRMLQTRIDVADRLSADLARVESLLVYHANSFFDR